MSDIATGRVYIIICIKNPKIFYIGSTFNQLRQRWIKHKQHYREKGRLPSICKYFDEYGVDNFTMKLLKSYDVVRTHNKDFRHLIAYEQLWINKLKGCCNIINPLNLLPKIQRKIYRENHKEKNKQYQIEYREKNKEYLNQKDREKYQRHKSTILKQNKENYKKDPQSIIEKTRQYYQDNKIKIKERTKDYREKNKEKIKEIKKIKIICECGLKICKDHLSRHRKTQIHLRLMNEK